jgi:hypothetical protein
MLAGQVDLIVSAVETEEDCLVCRAAVDIINELDTYLLGHSVSVSMVYPAFDVAVYVIEIIKWNGVVKYFLGCAGCAPQAGFTAGVFCFRPAWPRS